MSHIVAFLMKRILLLVIVFASCAMSAQNSLVDNLKQHVYTLAADSLLGRSAGSEQCRVAAQYIQGYYESLGLSVITDYFPTTTMPYFREGAFRNIYCVIEGTDPALKDEYIIVGAHYDHIGIKDNVSSPGADYIYNGADDNASGTAAVMEMARLIMQQSKPHRRTIIIVNFDAEEIGLVGSSHMAKSGVVSIESVKLMFSVDMVGYLQASKKLSYVGVGTLRDGASLFEGLPWDEAKGKVKLKAFEQGAFTATDTEPFAKLKVPTLYVTTGLKSPYHRPQDEADRIDYEGLSQVTLHLTALVMAAANADALESSGEIADKHGGKPSILAAGVKMSMGSSSLYYYDGPLTGKKAFGLQAGFWGRLYLDKLQVVALGIDPTYELLRTPTEYGMFAANAIMLPARLQIGTPSYMPACLYVYGGAYYRYYFASQLDGAKYNFDDPNSHNDYGWHFGIGVGIGQRVFLETNSYYGLKSPWSGVELKQRNRTNVISLGIRF